jgi:DNA-directed RNA polymerase subunit M/transcription elongation factor TFIIS
MSVHSMSEKQIKSLPAHRATGDAICPKCGRYNALIAETTRHGTVLVCRDCQHAVRPQ